MLILILCSLTHATSVLGQEILAQTLDAPGGEGDKNAAAAYQSKDGRFALQTVPVNVLPPSEVKMILAALVTPGGAVLDYPGKNSLMIVDLPAKIQRLVEIKELIDVQVFAAARLEIYQAKTASAEELAATAREVIQVFVSSAARADGFALELIPLPQANQILVISRSEEGRSEAKRWLERLDGAAGAARRIFVYPVEKGREVEMAEKSNQLLSQDKVVGQAQSPARGQPRVVADSASHSLIIYATAQEFQAIKNNMLQGDQQMEEFAKKLLAIRQEIESGLKRPSANGR